MKLSSAFVASLATASADLRTVKLNARAQREASSVDSKLSNWHDVADYQWYGKISVGTPAQDL